MTAEPGYSDEDLTCYLDAVMDPDRQRQLVAALERDAVLRDRLAALQVPGEALRDGLDLLLAAAPALPSLPAQRSSQFRMTAMAAAVAAALVVGVILGNGLGGAGRQTAGWHDYVAAYHALYVTETLTASVPDPKGADAGVAALSDLLGRTPGPALTDPVLTFRRGQVLGYRGQTLVQLAYLSPTGDPVALCILRLTDAPEAAVTTTELEGMAAAFWQRDGLAYLLIGGRDPALIRNAADRMAAGL